VRTARLAAIVVLFAGGGVSAQDRPEPPSAAPQPGERQPGPQEPALGPEQESPERVVGPTEGAPTMSLGAAVRLALDRNFQLLDSVDALGASRWQEKATFGQFLPAVTPLYQHSPDRTIWGVDLAQKVPWTGGTVTAAGRYLSEPTTLDTPLPKTTDLRLLLTQPLLRGVGPNATFFDLTNARRAVQGQQRSLALAQQRVAVEVAAAFYNVIAQRQLLEVARQSLGRTEALLKSSQARLEVGLASKLDVFRAELQAAQASDAMVRSEAALASALERFRGLLALPPSSPRRRRCPPPSTTSVPSSSSWSRRCRLASSCGRRATSWATRSGRPRWRPRTSSRSST
jgi:outer membrane protein TolC